MRGRTAGALVVAAVALVIIDVLVAGSRGDRSPATGGAAGDAIPSIALASSVTSPTRSSVIVAMGNLDEPTNTFWELFLRPAGGTSWSLRTPPGVADNGGLVVAAPTTGPVTAGFLTSALLTFSPLAQSPDSGLTWSPGSLPSALVATPDAMAAGSGVAPDLWAVTGRATQTVLVSSGGLSSWRPIVTTHVLSGSVPGCSVGAINAVATGMTGQLLLGVSCTHSGRIGVLEGSPSGSESGVQHWRNFGPSLRTSGSAPSTSVLRLERTAAGIAGLADVNEGAASSLVAFWLEGATGRWTGSSPVVVPTHWKVMATAVGGGDGAGETVLLGSGSERRIEVTMGPGGPWVTLAQPPAGTASVASIGNETDAFVVSGSHFTVWAWSPGAAGWWRSAAITVPIQYGSSG